MADRSGWARWYAAQSFVNSGKPAGEREMLHIASSVVLQKITDGELQVRGRLPGRMDYEPIPAAHWKSSALAFVEDPRTLWRMILIPRNGAEISANGTVRALDPVCEARTAELKKYDSLVVDALEFERLWPRSDPSADKKRRELLKRARANALDSTEVKRLS